jgi:hypothetical protein
MDYTVILFTSNFLTTLKLLLYNKHSSHTLIMAHKKRPSFTGHGSNQADYRRRAYSEEQCRRLKVAPQTLHGGSHIIADIRGRSLTTQPFSSSQNTAIPLDLDLDLESLWFAQNHPAFPPRTIDKSTCTYATRGGRSQSGARVTHTFSAVLQNNTTLGRTKIRLIWDQNYPEGVKAEQKHFPPPPSLSRHELESCQER